MTLICGYAKMRQLWLGVEAINKWPKSHWNLKIIVFLALRLQLPYNLSSIEYFYGFNVGPIETLEIGAWFCHGGWEWWPSPHDDWVSTLGFHVQWQTKSTTVIEHPEFNDFSNYQRSQWIEFFFLCRYSSSHIHGWKTSSPSELRFVRKVL